MTVHAWPASFVEARSKRGRANCLSHTESNSHPRDVSRKNTDAISSGVAVLGVMSFHSLPVFAVQKIRLLVAAHPTSGLSSFADFSIPATC